MSAEACQETEEHSALLKLLSALFYAGSSFLITVVNKTVLTTFRFPSYLCLGIGQMIMTVIVLYAAKKGKTVQFQDFDRSVLLKIFPLPLLYVGNHITGLASTKKTQFTHVYSFKEIHYIDDNDLGSIYTKKNISKMSCVQCCDYSLWCHDCCKFGPGL